MITHKFCELLASEMVKEVHRYSGKTGWRQCAGHKGIVDPTCGSGERGGVKKRGGNMKQGMKRGRDGGCPTPGKPLDFRPGLSLGLLGLPTFNRFPR